MTFLEWLDSQIDLHDRMAQTNQDTFYYSARLLERVRQEYQKATTEESWLPENRD